MNSHVRCLINQSEARSIQRTQCTPFSFRRFSLFMWIIFLRSAKFMEFFMVRTFSNIDAKMSESESERWINGCGTIVCDISLLQWIDRMFIQLLTEWYRMFSKCDTYTKWYPSECRANCEQFDAQRTWNIPCHYYFTRIFHASHTNVQLSIWRQKYWTRALGGGATVWWSKW